jgi:DGQHR domain-containing protein
MAGSRLTATVLKQNGVDLYMFKMNSAELRRVAWATPRDDLNPHEVQRLIKAGRAMEIGTYIKSAGSLLPGAIVVSLEKPVAVTKSAMADVVTIEFPDEVGKFAYILDGQHRLEGFKYAGGIEFDLPVVALLEATEAQRVKVFADINSKQEPVSKVQLDALYHQIRAGLPDDMRAMDVVERLGSDPDSPLFEHVQVRPDQKGRWVRNVALKTYVAPIVTGGGELAPKPVDEQARILKEYLAAVRDTWPTEWADRRAYSLAHPLGLETAFGIFQSVKHRVDLKLAAQYTKDNFAQMMAPIKSTTVTLGAASLPITWDRGTMTPFANAGGRKALREALKASLVAADEPDEVS